MGDVLLCIVTSEEKMALMDSTSSCWSWRLSVDSAVIEWIYDVCGCEKKSLKQQLSSWIIDSGCGLTLFPQLCPVSEF